MFKWDFFVIFKKKRIMSDKKLKTTQDTNEQHLKKTREYMERMSKTGREFNPAPKATKDDSKGKVSK